MSHLVPNTRQLNAPAAELLPVPRTVLDLMTPHGGKPRHIISIPNDKQDELLDLLATHHHAAHEHNVLAASNRPQNRAAVAQLRHKVEGLQQQERSVTQEIVATQESQSPGQPTPVEQLIDNHPRVQNPQPVGYESRPLQTSGTVGITTQFGPISLPCAIVPPAPASPYRVYTRANQMTRQFVPWPFYPCANYPCVAGKTPDRPHSLVVDVRSHAERQAGPSVLNSLHVALPLPPVAPQLIEGAAESIATRFPAGGEHSGVYVYCQKGIRSAAVVNALRRRGIPAVDAGGIQDPASLAYALVHQEGTVGFAGSLSIPLGVIPAANSRPRPRSLLDSLSPGEVREKLNQNAERIMRLRTKPASPQDVGDYTGFGNGSRLLQKMRPGDELWHFADDCGGMPLCGQWGIVLTRNGRYVDHTVSVVS